MGLKPLIEWMTKIQIQEMKEELMDRETNEEKDTE